jgi:hypothetical protein
VAKRAIRDLMPAQQRKYDNAFQVQGYETVVYNRLTTGLVCSCQAQNKVFTSILGEDGKMPEGRINELLTGGLEFKVQTYGNTSKGRDDLREPRNIPLLKRDNQLYGEFNTKKQPEFENDGALTDAYATVTGKKTGDMGARNELEQMDLDDIVENFDTNSYDNSGTKCTVCFGSGFVGGYSVLYGWRNVLTVNSPEFMGNSLNGTIEVNHKPNKFFAKVAVWTVVLPRNCIYIDAFKVWNNTDRIVDGEVRIDNIPYSDDLFRASCDGRPHVISIRFDDLTYFTHIEIQVCQSSTLALLEFPKLQSSTNIEVRDLTDDVQIIASPVIPKLAARDVLVESTFGKRFIVGPATKWNDRERNVMGWEVTSRVIQPSELLSYLPRRRKMGQRTTNPVRDNSKGIRRT